MSDLLRLNVPVEIKAAADGTKPPRISIMAYSGGTMRISGYGPVVIDLAGLDTSNPVQILAEHDDTIEGLLGTGTGTKTNGKVIVSGTLTYENPMVGKIVRMSQDGVQLSASVGVQPTEREHISAGQSINVNNQTIIAGQEGLTLVRRGTLRETSIVALGADSSTSVSIAASLQGKNKMSENQNQNQEELIRAEMVAMLAENQPGISQPEKVLARWGREEWNDATGLPHQRAEKMMRAALAGKVDYSTFERELLTERLNDSEVARIRASRPQAPAIHGSSRDMGGDVLEAALLCHLGHENISAKLLGDQATQNARNLHLNSLHDILRAQMQHIGMNVPAGRDAMIKAAFSTVAISGILGNAANKVSIESYLAAPSVARTVAKKLNANDFKTHTGYRLTGNATFEEVPNAGEIKHGNLTEQSFTFKVDTYARMFGLTRQDVINDDLHKFEEVPRLLGRGAAVKLEQIFWTLVLANTGSFFHGDNNNLVTSAALGIAGLGDAVEALRKLVDDNGDPISIVPKYLVVPPELEATADQLYASTNVIYPTTAESTPDSNPFKGKYQPQVSPYLSNSNYTGYSATSWYLFGDPADVAAFGIAYLNNIETPTIEQADSDFNTLGIQFRGYHDFGVCQVDKCGAIKATT